MYEGVHDFYVSRGFGGRVGFGKRPALVVIDMAKSWLDESSPLGSSRLGPVLDATVELLRIAREHNHPVFFTTMSYTDFDVAGALGRKLTHASAGRSLSQGAGLSDLDPRLGRRSSEPVIVKPRASAFWGTPFDSYLISLSIDTLIISGCSTSGCVRATAESAHNLNLHPIIVEEAVGDRSPEAHLANLTDIDLRYGDVTKLDDVVSYLKTVKA